MKTTNNSIKYNFSDFTFKHYIEILRLVKQTHQFSTYANFKKDTNFVLNRHDVDFDIEKTISLGKIENDLGIVSTYFFMLHSKHYNVLEKKSIEIIRELKSLGHQIGLHFDLKFYNIKKEEDLEEKIEFEKEILEYYLEDTVKVFSFHNTTEFSMNCKKLKYGGLINTYASFFQEKVKYCSDSNGYWRFNRMYDFIKKSKHEPLQLLTHPVWWDEIIKSPKEKLFCCIDKKAYKTKKEYKDFLMKNNKENIDW